MATIKQVFDDEFEGVEFDRKLCARVIEYSNRYMTNTRDKSEFFGSPLLGVYPIRFLESDRDAWFSDVFGVDEVTLQEKLRKTPNIDPSFNVMSDCFNYVPFYLIHRLTNDRSNIPMNIKLQAMTQGIVVLHCRFLTGLMFKRFEKYQADPAAAREAYNQLNGRFDMRKYGSWRSLFEARGVELAKTNPLYNGVRRNFAPDKKVIETVTTTQGRLRALVNNYYGTYIKVVESHRRISTQGATMINMDGETVLRDRTRGFATYQRYIREVAQDESSFIKPELVQVVLNITKNAPKEVVTQSLKYISKHVGTRGNSYIDDMLSTTLTYLFSYLNNAKNELRQDDLAGIIQKFRTVLSSSRVSDPDVIKLRKWSDQLVRKAHHTRTPSVITGTRIAVLVYIAIRALTREHYQG